SGLVTSTTAAAPPAAPSTKVIAAAPANPASGPTNTTASPVPMANPTPGPAATITTTSGASTGSTANQTAASPLPTPPVIVAPQSSPVAVGGALDTTIQPGSLGGSSVTYTITPQPLPANMTFNRQTGALSFAPAPGQAGTYPFSITATS